VGVAALGKKLKSVTFSFINIDVFSDLPKSWETRKIIKLAQKIESFSYSLVYNVEIRLNQF
jgi:hypothetical protein